MASVILKNIDIFRAANSCGIVINNSNAVVSGCRAVNCNYAGILAISNNNHTLNIQDSYFIDNTQYFNFTPDADGNVNVTTLPTTDASSFSPLNQTDSKNIFNITGSAKKALTVSACNISISGISSLNIQDVSATGCKYASGMIIHNPPAGTNIYIKDSVFSDNSEFGIAVLANNAPVSSVGISSLEIDSCNVYSNEFGGVLVYHLSGQQPNPSSIVGYINKLNIKNTQIERNTVNITTDPNSRAWNGAAVDIWTNVNQLSCTNTNISRTEFGDALRLRFDCYSLDINNCNFDGYDGTAIMLQGNITSPRIHNCIITNTPTIEIPSKYLPYQYGIYCNKAVNSVSVSGCVISLNFDKGLYIDGVGVTLGSIAFDTTFDTSPIAAPFTTQPSSRLNIEAPIFLQVNNNTFRDNIDGSCYISNSRGTLSNNEFLQTDPACNPNCNVIVDTGNGRLDITSNKFFSSRVKDFTRDVNILHWTCASSVSDPLTKLPVLQYKWNFNGISYIKELNKVVSPTPVNGFFNPQTGEENIFYYFWNHCHIYSQEPNILKYMRFKSSDDHLLWALPSTNFVVPVSKSYNVLTNPSSITHQPTKAGLTPAHYGFHGTARSLRLPTLNPDTSNPQEIDIPSNIKDVAEYNPASLIIKTTNKPCYDKINIYNNTFGGKILFRSASQIGQKHPNIRFEIDRTRGITGSSSTLGSIDKIGGGMINMGGYHHGGSTLARFSNINNFWEADGPQTGPDPNNTPLSLHPAPYYIKNPAVGDRYSLSTKWPLCTDERARHRFNESSFMYTGAWSCTRQYKFGECVGYNGEYYGCIQVPNQNRIPTDSSSLEIYWSIINDNNTPYALLDDNVDITYTKYLRAEAYSNRRSWFIKNVVKKKGASPNDVRIPGPLRYRPDLIDFSLSDTLPLKGLIAVYKQEVGSTLIMDYKPGPLVNYQFFYPRENTPLAPVIWQTADGAPEPYPYISSSWGSNEPNWYKFGNYASGARGVFGVAAYNFPGNATTCRDTAAWYSSGGFVPIDIVIAPGIKCYKLRIVFSLTPGPNSRSNTNFNLMAFQEFDGGRSHTGNVNFNRYGVRDLMNRAVYFDAVTNQNSSLTSEFNSYTHEVVYSNVEANALLSLLLFKRGHTTLMPPSQYPVGSDYTAIEPKVVRRKPTVAGQCNSLFLRPDDMTSIDLLHIQYKQSEGEDWKDALPILSPMGGILFDKAVVKRCDIVNTSAFITAKDNLTNINIFNSDSSIPTSIGKLDLGTYGRANNISNINLNSPDLYQSSTGDGIIKYDKLIYRYDDRTGVSEYRHNSPSETLVPDTSNSFGIDKRHRSSLKMVPVDSGETTTIFVQIRISPDYLSQPDVVMPRLMLKTDFAVGIQEDIVLDTANFTEDWQTLTATTPAAAADGIHTFYIDCKGSDGYINVDTWSAST